MLAQPKYFFVFHFGFFPPPPPQPLFFGGPWAQNSMLDVVSKSIIFSILYFHLPVGLKFPNIWELENLNYFFLVLSA
jgi:hypothetical protein